MTTQVTITNEGPKSVRLAQLDELANRADPVTLAAGESYTATMWGGQCVKIVEVPDEEAAEPVDGAAEVGPEAIG